MGLDATQEESPGTGTTSTTDSTNRTCETSETSGITSFTKAGHEMALFYTDNIEKLRSCRDNLEKTSRKLNYTTYMLAKREKREKREKSANTDANEIEKQYV
jgi:cysteine sulfinate desulfinase/cysteine desulfurase-like protein